MWAAQLVTRGGEVPNRRPGDSSEVHSRPVALAPEQEARARASWRFSAGAASSYRPPAVTNPARVPSESSKSADSRPVMCPTRLVGVASLGARRGECGRSARRAPIPTQIDTGRFQESLRA